jgi:hypothetical protein
VGRHPGPRSWFVEYRRLQQRIPVAIDWVWDWIHSHTPPRTRSPSSCHPPFTHYPFPLRSLVCGGQHSPHKPRLVVSHITCPLLSSSPHAHSFVLDTEVINTHTIDCTPRTWIQSIATADVHGVEPPVEKRKIDIILKTNPKENRDRTGGKH